MNRSTIGRRYGLHPTLPDPMHECFHNHSVIQRSADMPAGCMTLVLSSPMAIDQMKVGMCTGCGTSRALKNRMAFLKYQWPFMPSSLDIYAKVRQFEGTPLTTDSGASIGDIMTVLNEQGVCPEDSNPTWSWAFSASDDRWQQAPPPACDTNALKHKLIKFLKLNQDVDSIKTALFNGFPVIIGIAVHESFESDKVAQTGIVPMPGWFDRVLGGHCLRLDAWGMYNADYADGVNSWGQEWGDTWTGFPQKGRGRFHIPFEYLVNPNLTSDLWAVEIVT